MYSFYNANSLKIVIQFEKIFSLIIVYTQGGEFWYFSLILKENLSFMLETFHFVVTLFTSINKKPDRK